MSERPWKLEAVAALFAGLMFGLLTFSLIAMGFTHFVPSKALSSHRLLQFILSTFSFHALALVLIHLFLRAHGVGWSELLGFRKLRWHTVLSAVAAAVVVLPLALALNSLSAVVLTKLHVEPVEQQSMQALELSITMGQKIVFGLAAIVVAPLVEESLFRGIVYPTMKQQGYPRLALYGSSLVFAIIHLNLMTLLPLFFLALVFVFLLERTDTLMTPLIAHSCFNGANFFVYLNRTDIGPWWKDLLRGLKHALPT